MQVPPDERARLPVHGPIMCALAVLGDAEALITLWTSPAVRLAPSARTPAPNQPHGLPDRTDLCLCGL